jgi:hypothetical protein
MITNPTNKEHVYEEISVSVGRLSGYQGIRFNLVFWRLMSLFASISREKE